MSQNSESLFRERSLLRDLGGLVGGEGVGDLYHPGLLTSYYSQTEATTARQRPPHPAPLMRAKLPSGVGVEGEPPFKSWEEAEAQRGDGSLPRLRTGRGEANGQGLSWPACLQL